MERAVKILFTFENPLPNHEADAEVFVNTAKSLAPHVKQSWLHVPVPDRAAADKVSSDIGIPVIRAMAPSRPAVLRHLLCGLTLACRREFREADLVYTRNLWVAWLALVFGQRVVFDHYRPWADQIPPLRVWIYRIMSHRRFVVHICHSEYTRQKYLSLGVPANRLECVHNGFEPRRLGNPMDRAAAKQAIDVDPGRTTVVYTGRINKRKGLELVIEAARRLSDIQFVLVGSYGEGPIERLAEGVANVRIVPWQPQAALSKYIFAADVLLIPPTSQPLMEFGTTVLPLKVFLYLAAGRPIIAGDTPDVSEILIHGKNAFLCRPDDLESLVAGIQTLATDPALCETLAATARDNSRDLTWEARGTRIINKIQNAQPRLSASRSGPWFWNWVGESARWFVHLIRRRSWVLPPSGRTSKTGASSSE